ncbi:hypothetical protein FI667_g2897, partial [Globisporangium splendens]
MLPVLGQQLTIKSRWQRSEMATEELSLDDIAAYLETFEPCPALWSFSTLDDSDLDDLHTLLEPSGDPQPAQSENHEQEQQTDPEAPELKSNASSSNGESDLRTIYHDTEQQQNDTTRSNPQPWWSETHEWLLDTVIPERSPQNSNCSSSDEVNNTNSSCQANQQRQRKTKPRKPTTRAKRSRNPSREKMQDELKALRVQSKELHEQLTMLQEHSRRIFYVETILLVMHLLQQGPAPPKVSFPVEHILLSTGYLAHAAVHILATTLLVRSLTRAVR